MAERTAQDQVSDYEEKYAKLHIEGFQGTPEEIERQWFDQVYTGRGDSMLQLTWRAILMGGALGGILSLTNLYIGLKAGWGFGVAIRKDVFEEMGGWSNTLLEDADFAGKLLKSGYKIQYEPQAMASTIEPESWGDLKRQRIRWGKGSAFAFFHHRTSYKRNPQFLIYFMPYLFLFFAVIGFLVFQTWMFVLPLASLYIVYTFSLKEFVLFLMVFFIPLFSNLVTSVAAGTVSHMAILTASESNRPKEFLLAIPFVCLFIPYVMAYYLKGICSAIKAKKRKQDELDFRYW